MNYFSHIMQRDADERRHMVGHVFPRTHVPGIAFEVHNAYNDLDKQKILDVLLSVIFGRQTIPDLNDNELFDILQRLVEGMEPNKTLDEADIVKTQEFWKSPEVERTVRSIFKSGTLLDRQMVRASLNYVRMQNSQYRSNYARFLVQNIATAYSKESSCEVDVSCVKGAREQMVFCLESATLGQEEKKEFKKLIDAFHKKRIPLEIFNSYASMFAEQHPEIEENESLSPESKLEQRIQFMREKLIESGLIKPNGGAALDGDDPPEFKDYYTHILPKMGGKTKRKYKRKSIKRKSRNKRSR